MIGIHEKRRKATQEKTSPSLGKEVVILTGGMLVKEDDDQTEKSEFRSI